MKERSIALIISVAVLGLWGIERIVDFLPALVQLGEMSLAARIVNVLSYVGSGLLWFGLACVQWRTAGRWGRRIAIFAVFVLGVQSYLIYLAVSRGRVPVDFSFVANTMLTALMTVMLVVCGFVTFGEYRRRTASVSVARS